jgi:hypothetical protein
MKENIRRSMSREDFVSFGSLILGGFLFQSRSLANIR